VTSLGPNTERRDLLGGLEAGPRPGKNWIAAVPILSHDLFKPKSETVIVVAITGQPQMASFPLTLALAAEMLPKTYYWHYNCPRDNTIVIVPMDVILGFAIAPAPGRWLRALWSRPAHLFVTLGRLLLLTVGATAACYLPP
jgi:hypothetical protein